MVVKSDLDSGNPETDTMNDNNVTLKENAANKKIIFSSAEVYENSKKKMDNNEINNETNKNLCNELIVLTKLSI